MEKLLKRAWPLIKALTGLLVVAAVGWQFWRILQNPDLQAADTVWRARPEWLVASAVFYVLGLAWFLAFWVWLLRRLDQSPLPPAAIRAYFIGHLGKYVPGKAWALLLRTTLIRGVGVRLGVAALTAIYETLTTMASGALLAAILLAWQSDAQGDMIWKALGLLAVAGIPILPGVFNTVVARLSRPFLKADATPLPPLKYWFLLVGLAFTGVGWLFIGMSLWSVQQAVRPELQFPELQAILRATAFIGLAYVAGFLALPAPGGIGVREFILQQCLQPDLGAAHSVVAVLLLRLLWTAAEAIMAGGVWWLPGQPRVGKAEA